MLSYKGTWHLKTVKAVSQPHLYLEGLLLTSVHTQLACIFTKLLSIVNAASQPFLWLEGLLLTLVQTQLGWHINTAVEESQCSLTSLLVALDLLFEAKSAWCPLVVAFL